MLVRLHGAVRKVPEEIAIVPGKLSSVVIMAVVLVRQHRRPVLVLAVGQRGGQIPSVRVGEVREARRRRVALTIPHHNPVFALTNR